MRLMPEKLSGQALNAVSVYREPDVFFCNDQSDSMFVALIGAGEQQEVTVRSPGVRAVKNTSVITGIEKTSVFAEAGFR